MPTIFISYASEDRDEVARPLAELLIKKGINVWFDEYELNVGSSLRNSIDKGLSNSDYGLVVLSLNFFKKQWTEYELNSLITLERAYSKKMILPVWHKLGVNDIIKYSPNLLDTVATKTDFGFDKVIADVLKVINSKEHPEFTKPDLNIITVEKPVSFNMETIIELLKELKKTRYLWLGLCELDDFGKVVSEDIKESTLSNVKSALDKLLLMGLLVYETKYSYEMTTTKQRVHSIRVTNIPTQIRNLIRLIQNDQI